MVAISRSPGKSSGLNYKKSSRALGSVVALSLCIFLTACQSADKKSSKSVSETEAIVDKKEKLYNVRALSLLGENRQARFSPHGNKLIFVSELRALHRHPQIYMLDLDARTELRLTYQDGENASPTFDPVGNGFLYSSNTDEIKEDPQYIRESLARLQGKVPPQAEELTKGELSQWKDKKFEIYWSNWDGTSIDRLTYAKAYDSEASLHPAFNIMVFSSLRGGVLNLYTMNRQGKNQKLLRRSPLYEAEAVYSPNGKNLLWVSYSKDFKQSQIVLGTNNGKKLSTLTSAPAFHQSPRWFPDGEWILFSSDRSSKGNFDLYVTRSDGSCLHRLTYHLGQDVDPDISPDGTQISFTSDRSGTPQLHLMTYKKPESCPEDAPPGRLKK